MTHAQSVVLFDEIAAVNGRIAIATLNAPRRLNALNLEMIELLGERLHEWADDPEVAMVVLQGEGNRAFCAGGDIRDVVRETQETGTTRFAENYFTSEYRLDYQIHTYAKPILLWGHGVVMGGGIGLMNGASHRVVTPESLLAMPEITIGLFPDVGATWFLNHMPGRSGLFAGLTGLRLTPGDALFAGLADYLLEATSHADLLRELERQSWSPEPRENHERLSAVLRDFALPWPASPLGSRLEAVNTLVDHSDTAAIVKSVCEAAADDPWFQECADRLAHGSPTSARVIHEQYRRGKHLSLREAFQMELGLAVQMACHHDFAEGVRALLIDKDNQPQWRPAAIDHVTEDAIDDHFASPWDQASHPLNTL